jgi:predicted nucleotidyltransferase
MSLLEQEYWNDAARGWGMSKGARMEPEVELKVESEVSAVELIKQALIEHYVPGKLHVDHLELYCRNTEGLSAFEALNLLGFSVDELASEIEGKLKGD